jgi:putative heme-binding domain-containing protein
MPTRLRSSLLIALALCGIFAASAANLCLHQETDSNRANLNYILAPIITPSEEIQDAYKLVTINTQDGRVLAGDVIAEDDQKLTLRLVGQDTIIAKSAILSRETSPVSMMPEGLLKNLPSDDIRDLIATLKTTKQVPLSQP